MGRSYYVTFVLQYYRLAGHLKEAYYEQLQQKVEQARVNVPKSNLQIEGNAMRKLKQYLDTSVISHLFADDTPEKKNDTNKLWGEFSKGKYEVYISPLVIEEIKACNEPKRSQMLDKLEQIQYETLELSDAVSHLAGVYLNSGVLKEKSHGDCLHIAFAIVSSCDIIVSWSFKHLVNYKTINKVKIVNAINRYQEISIISPTMLIEEVD